MSERLAVAVAMLAATAITQLCLPATASADEVAPQADTPCSATVANAMTMLADGRTILLCQGQGGGYQWKTVTADYPSSSRWLTYGPALILHGEGTRNSNLPSGDWTALPQAPDSQCIAVQIPVVGAGVVGPQATSKAPAGQPLSFMVVNKLFSITLTGYCLWTAQG